MVQRHCELNLTRQAYVLCRLHLGNMKNDRRLPNDLILFAFVNTWQQ